jgi:hypothetical protein
MLGMGELFKHIDTQWLISGSIASLNALRLMRDKRQSITEDVPFARGARTDIVNSIILIGNMVRTVSSL